METSVEAQSIACPSCGDVISNPRYFCPHCTRPIRNTVTCECCKEPISAEAKKCPHCNMANAALLAAQAGQLQLTVVASPFGAFFSTWNFTSLLRPPVIEVKGGKINTTVWSFFTLRVHQSEIEISRVASVRHTKGVIWSSLMFLAGSELSCASSAFIPPVNPILVSVPATLLLVVKSCGL